MGSTPNRSVRNEESRMPMLRPGMRGIKCGSSDEFMAATFAFESFGPCVVMPVAGGSKTRSWRLSVASVTIGFIGS
jgi:hypothetical protein